MPNTVVPSPHSVRQNTVLKRTARFQILSRWKRFRCCGIEMPLGI